MDEDADVAEIEIPADADPAATLAAVTALRRLADRLERDAVDRAVALGWSWAHIAQALGVSRQAAHKRHADRLRRSDRSTKEHR